MRRTAAVLALGLLATLVQSVLAGVLPPAACPDLGLLVVMAIALTWRSAGAGLLLAALLGCSADLLSGTLFGQHLLLRVLVFCGTGLVRASLNLLGVLPQAVLAALWSAANAWGLAVTSSFFAPDLPLAAPPLGALAVHAAVNAAAAPLVVGLVARLVARLGKDDAGARVVSFEPRSFQA